MFFKTVHTFIFYHYHHEEATNHFKNLCTARAKQQRCLFLSGYQWNMIHLPWQIEYQHFILKILQICI